MGLITERISLIICIPLLEAYLGWHLPPRGALNVCIKLLLCSSFRQVLQRFKTICI